MARCAGRDRHEAADVLRSQWAQQGFLNTSLARAIAVASHISRLNDRPVQPVRVCSRVRCPVGCGWDLFNGVCRLSKGRGLLPNREHHKRGTCICDGSNVSKEGSSREFMGVMWGDYTPGKSQPREGERGLPLPLAHQLTFWPAFFSAISKPGMTPLLRHTAGPCRWSPLLQQRVDIDPVPIAHACHESRDGTTSTAHRSVWTPDAMGPRSRPPRRAQTAPEAARLLVAEVRRPVPLLLL